MPFYDSQGIKHYSLSSGSTFESDHTQSQQQMASLSLTTIKAKWDKVWYAQTIIPLCWAPVILVQIITWHSTSPVQRSSGRTLKMKVYYMASIFMLKHVWKVTSFLPDNIVQHKLQTVNTASSAKLQPPIRSTFCWSLQLTGGHTWMGTDELLVPRAAPINIFSIKDEWLHTQVRTAETRI